MRKTSLTHGAAGNDCVEEAEQNHASAPIWALMSGNPGNRKLIYWQERLQQAQFTTAVQCRAYYSAKCHSVQTLDLQLGATAEAHLHSTLCRVLALDSTHLAPTRKTRLWSKWCLATFFSSWARAAKTISKGEQGRKAYLDPG